MSQKQNYGAADGADDGGEQTAQQTSRADDGGEDHDKSSDLSGEQQILEESSACKASTMLVLLLTLALVGVSIGWALTTCSRDLNDATSEIQSSEHLGANHIPSEALLLNLWKRSTFEVISAQRPNATTLVGSTAGEVMRWYLDDTAAKVLRPSGNYAETSPSERQKWEEELLQKSVPDGMAEVLQEAIDHDLMRDGFAGTSALELQLCGKAEVTQKTCLAGMFAKTWQRLRQAETITSAGDGVGQGVEKVRERIEKWVADEIGDGGAGASSGVQQGLGASPAIIPPEKRVAHLLHKNAVALKGIAQLYENHAPRPASQTGYRPPFLTLGVLETQLFFDVFGPSYFLLQSSSVKWTLQGNDRLILAFLYLAMHSESPSSLLILPSEAKRMLFRDASGAPRVTFRELTQVVAFVTADMVETTRVEDFFLYLPKQRGDLTVFEPHSFSILALHKGSAAPARFGHLQTISLAGGLASVSLGSPLSWNCDRCLGDGRTHRHLSYGDVLKLFLDRVRRDPLCGKAIERPHMTTLWCAGSRVSTCDKFLRQYTMQAKERTERIHIWPKNSLQTGERRCLKATTQIGLDSFFHALIPPPEESPAFFSLYRSSNAPKDCSHLDPESRFFIMFNRDPPVDLSGVEWKDDPVYFSPRVRFAPPS